MQNCRWKSRACLEMKGREKKQDETNKRKLKVKCRVEKEKKRIDKKEPVAQRHEMVIDNLALLWYFLMKAFMKAGQQPEIAGGG